MARKKLALLKRWCGSLYPEKETTQSPEAHSVLNSNFLGMVLEGRSFYFPSVSLSQWAEALNVDWYRQNTQRKLMLCRASGSAGLRKGPPRPIHSLRKPSSSFPGCSWICLPSGPKPISFFALAHCHFISCGLPEVSGFKHFNYNFNYINPFSCFPS